MIKPYKILSTEEHSLGTIVLVSVSDRSTVVTPEGGISEIVSTISSTILVPTGEDMDQYLFNYLMKSNWITQ